MTETPLGYHIHMPATVTDREARRNIIKVEIEGLTYGEGGAFMEDETGNCYFEAFMCQGTLGVFWSFTITTVISSPSVKLSSGK